MFPLVVHTLDLVVSAVGIMSIGAKAKPPKGGGEAEDPYAVMKRGYAISAALSAVAFCGACRLLLHTPAAPRWAALMASPGCLAAATPDPALLAH